MPSMKQLLDGRASAPGLAKNDRGPHGSYFYSGALAPPNLPPVCATRNGHDGMFRLPYRAYAIHVTRALRVYYAFLTLRYSAESGSCIAD
jgi:hypothetical protein